MIDRRQAAPLEKQGGTEANRHSYLESSKQHVDFLELEVNIPAMRGPVNYSFEVHLKRSQNG